MLRLGRLVLVLALCAAATGVSGCAEGPSEQCRRQEQLIGSLRPDDPVTVGAPVAVVLGDSYTQGVGVADPRTQGWATGLGRLEGWTTFVDGVGGSGYVAGGPCVTKQFGTRLPVALSRRPQVVVVEGGLNDATVPPDRLAPAVDAVLAGLRAVPTVIVVGPTDAPARPTAGAVDALLRDRTLAAGRRYVSTHGRPFPFLPDHLHLTPEGYRELARAVAAQLTG